MSLESDNTMPEKGNDIWEKVYHTDSKVSALETEVSSIKEQVHVIGSGVGRIEAAMLNKPGPNYLAWLGAFLVVVSMLGATLFGLVEYQDLTLDPIRDELHSREEALDEFWKFKNEMHYEMGRIHEWKEDTGQELDDMFQRLREQERRVWGLSSEP